MLTVLARILTLSVCVRWRYVLAVALVGCRFTDLVQTPTSGQLQFSVQPSRAPAGTSITPPVQITVLDEMGRPDTTYSQAVTLSLEANPGEAELSGATT